MNALKYILFLALLLLFLGCGSPKSSELASETPLTVEEWSTLAPEIKYEIETLERLRQGNPKLQNQREWDKFAREVVLPSYRKEVKSKS